MTKLFEQGLDIKQVQYLAGHATPEMTMRVYTHYREKQRAADTAEQVRAGVDYL
ncbi:MAG: tyrosine-type recombinase/integrase [Oscillospiraceae bacterium]|nr:tyrosine-type recombinase/integrase [Oscillospiraceae bacterium]